MTLPTTPKDARAYIRDIAFHAKRIEDSARFAEYHGASVKECREIRAVAEALRRKAGGVR